MRRPMLSLCLAVLVCGPAQAQYFYSLDGPSPSLLFFGLTASDILATGDDPPFLISGNDDGARITDLLTTFAEVIRVLGETN